MKVEKHRWPFRDRYTFGVDDGGPTPIVVSILKRDDAVEQAREAINLAVGVRP